MLPWNVELLLWIDNELEIEVVGVAQGAARSGHIKSGDWQVIADFATREGFSECQLVLRPEGPDDKRVYKDIADWERLSACFEAGVACSGSYRSTAVLAIDMHCLRCSRLLDQRATNGATLRIFTARRDAR